MVRLSKGFYLSSLVVNFVATILLIVGIFFLLRQDVSDALIFLAIGIIGLLYSAVVIFVLYYRMWEAIQDGHARTSPGEAVGFLFIPFFNVYWMFQVTWGFAQDYNAYVARHSINAKKLSEGFFLAATILSFAVIPFVIMVSQICDAVNAIQAAGEQQRANQPDRLAESEGQSPRLREVPHKDGHRSFSLYCLSGEFANQMLAIPAEGVSIGRDPKRVNLVLASSEISGAHARVVPEPKSPQLWLEDLHSMNGTFYSQQPGTAAAWVRLQGKVLLSPGARFRLSTDGPEFEIRG